MNLLEMFKRYVVFAALFLSHTVFATSDTLGKIEVHIHGIDVEQGGNLLVLLYNNEESWLEVKMALEIKSEPGLKEKIVVLFENLPYSDKYAVQVIHDKNNNGELDMRTLPYPKPKEGFAVSNNTYRMGPPSYDAAQINLDRIVVVTYIDLLY